MTNLQYIIPIILENQTSSSNKVIDLEIDKSKESTMHSKPKSSDYIAVALNNNCLEIIIDPDLDLTSAAIRILGENRNLLIEFKEPEYKTNVCIYTGKPMFIELHTPSGVAVKYVEGSGGDFYNII